MSEMSLFVLKRFNLVLTAFIGFLFCAAISTFFMDLSPLFRIRPPALALREGLCAFSTQALKKAPSRFLFETPPVPKVQISADPEADRKLLNRLSLVGIFYGDEPTAAIESPNQHKTVFVKKGDEVFTFQVIDIKEDEVVLTKDGSRYSLTL